MSDDFCIGCAAACSRRHRLLIEMPQLNAAMADDDVV